MAFEKLLAFTKDVSDLGDQPSLTPTELKAQFDAAPDEVRQYLNKLIDALIKTTAGDSGAKSIGASTISGLTGSNVQTLLEAINTKFSDGATRLGIYAKRNVDLDIPSGQFMRVKTDVAPTGQQTSQWDGGKFTAPKQGVYNLSVFAGTAAMPQFGAIEMYYFKNGVQQIKVDKQVAPGVTSLTLQGNLNLVLNAGDYVEFHVFSSADTKLTNSTGITIAAITP